MNVFLLASQTTRQARHRSTPVSHLHAPKVTPTRTQGVEEHGYTHPEYAGGTGVTFISGYWNKRNGGGPFPLMITRQAEKPVNDNTGIPDMGPTHAGQGTLGWSVTSLTPNGRAG